MSNRIMMLLMIFLISCNAHIRPQLLRDISFQFDRCRIRCWDIANQETIPFQMCDDRYQSKGAIDFPIEYCDGIAGFKLEVIAEYILPDVKEAIEECQDTSDRRGR